MHEKKTVVKNIENPNFQETMTFPIKDKQSNLSYKLFSANTNKFIGEIDVPLYMINLENEEIYADFEIKDDSYETIGIFKPNIIIVTSYYDMYQKQYDNIDKNIESYQSRINQLSQTLEDISLPYKEEFERSQLRLLKGTARLKMSDTPLVKQDIIPVDINDINGLKTQLQNEKIKNIELNKKIKQLENKNKDYEQKINLLERELNKYKSKTENNKIKVSKDNQNNNLINSILEKDKEIKELRLKLSRYPIQLEEGEKLISIIFV